MGVVVNIIVSVWRPEENLWDSALSFTTWVSGIKLRLAGLRANAFTF